MYFFAKYLAKNGINVTLIVPPAKEAPRFTDFQGISNLKLVYVGPRVNEYHPYIRPFVYRIFLRKVARYLRDNHFDIVHSFGLCPPEYFDVENRAPVVVAPFGSEEFVNRKKENFLRRIYLDVFMRNPKRYAIENADAVASEGELQTQEIVDLFGVPKEKIFLLPDGVDLRGIRAAMGAATITKREAGLQDADVVLINVNRLAKNKGTTYLVEALGILSKKLNVKLILVGGGPEEERIKKQISALNLEDKVLHFKNIADEKMYQLYVLADISVTPTLYEGLPLVILEAMACGKPIVASDVSEVPQVVRNGENGFLVPPKNPLAIAEAVLKIRDRNLFEAMGRRSQEIIKDYDWNVIAKKAIAEYKALTERT